MTSALLITSLAPVRAEDQKSTFEERELPVATLTRQMRQGMDEAWRQFHCHYYLALLRYAASRLGSANDAADVVQQVYLRIGRHIRQFDDEAAFWRWLLCVARCAAEDYRRGVRRRAMLLEKFAHWRQAEDSASTLPLGKIGEDSICGVEILEYLRKEDSEVLRLKYYEGWTTDEIAAQTGATPKAVENRLSRARQRVRDIIATKDQ